MESGEFFDCFAMSIMFVDLLCSTGIGDRLKMFSEFKLFKCGVLDTIFLFTEVTVGSREGAKGKISGVKDDLFWEGLRITVTSCSGEAFEVRSESSNPGGGGRVKFRANGSFSRTFLPS